ncbi:hypothetical protein BCR44DRAFT_1185684 [Catenaria anguillulae PL171]|uniref:Cache domain-containing protein n=1 Tax=Catenaria anguillulae PL171 TaxID=765915 RepID=A0A1Y2HIU5_9FUNG|nr:hypothetical protein BCR44DRAFT_1185684 [Catenaria anguillulae PL171]
MVTFSREHHRETVAKAVKALQVRINTAERLVRIQRAGWDAGVLGDATPAMRQRTFRDLLDMIVAYKDSVAAVYYTSRTMGLNGYYVERTADSGYAYQVWDTDASGTFLNYAIDPESGARIGDIYETPGYNASDEVWVTTVMPPRKHAPPMWTKPYGWGTTLWLTLSNPVFGSEGELAAIAGVDFDLGFITSILQKILDEQKQKAEGTAAAAANVTTYLFDASGDAILGSSIPSNIITRLEFDGNYRTLSMAELGDSVDPRLDLVSDYIRAQNSRLGARARWSFTVPGYFVETAIVNSTYPGSNLRWILVQLASQDPVINPLNDAANITKARLVPRSPCHFLRPLVCREPCLLG